MRKILLFLLFSLFIAFSTFAQVSLDTPVTWVKALPSTCTPTKKSQALIYNYSTFRFYVCIQTNVYQAIDSSVPTLDAQISNTFYAGPTTGDSQVPAFRALVSNDIPLIGADKISGGVFDSSLIPSLDASKVTTGTFGVARIPNLPGSIISSGTVGASRLGSGTTDTTTYLRGDGAWTAPPFVGTTDTRVEKDLSLFSNDLLTATNSLCPSSNCGTGKTIVISQPYTQSSSINLPAGLNLKIGGEGKITLGASVTLGVQSFNDPGNRKVFDTSASGASVVFFKNSVSEIKTVWWSGPTAGIDISDALGEALYSANNYQIPIHLPQGLWLTTGNLQVLEGVTIRGEGNHLLSNLGTFLQLSSPVSDSVFKIGEINYSVRFENFGITGLGTSGKYGVKFSGTYPNSSGDVFFDKVTIQNFAIGVYHNDIEVGSNVDWQMAQVQINQCVFNHNDIAIKTESLNSGWTITSTNFYNDVGDISIYAQGIGITTITGCEFAGPGGVGNGSKAFVVGAAHVNINLISNQDEGNEYFFENNASDITGMVNFTGNLIQGKVQLNYTMSLTSLGNNYVPDAIRIVMPAAPHISSQFDHIRTDAGTPEAPGTIPANPLRLVKSNDPITQFEFDPSLGLGTAGVTEGAMKVRHYSKFILPLYLSSASTSTPVVQILDAGSSDGLTQTLLRLGRANDSTQVADNYYDVWRVNSGAEAGRMQIYGNQTGFSGYDLKNGDLFVEGSIRSQTCTYTTGTTLAFDSRCGNSFAVTLTGNATFSVGTLSATDQTKADGQRITVELIQDATGSRTCTLDTSAGSFLFGTDITSITCSTAATKSDLLTVQYSKRKNKWLVLDFKKGF